MAKKSYATGFWLCFFLGWLGVHKFYFGKTGLGLLYLFTFGLAGIGWLFDFISLLMKMIEEKNKSTAHYAPILQHNKPAPIQPLQNLTSHEVEVKVTGVTYANDDGTNRQDIISEMNGYEDIELKPYLYEGRPAVGVYLDDGRMLGNVPKEYSERVYEALINNRCSASILKIYPADDKPAGVRIGISYVDDK